ncbi:MspA family porin [Rhodococcus sp. IEGM 1401]|uniref:MspA family porin n=1 Tax=unclassified Rhodococcus (in: high G+C Gram-positive bacteria) TaxID=192944 RepID=UPI0022B4E0C5|nr:MULTISPECIES: MspA family porin [unclassified Rhodococcus (in: high G+C Gram-positive bacteria)]MCZ4560986.1 MspA family porin [Rhodococcus sp. IEGM 1401]MDI9921108.1 MspA family porin [Rhodococcus sp. IEGM 1372]MDV8033561.1 MspA family porin [Rhodococcus sp. IEGM 1414]
MTEIQKSRRSRGLKSMSVAVAASASVVGLVLGTGTASAAVDSSKSIVDADGNTVVLTLSDSFVSGVAPLDGNPLTREWFYDGRATFDVQGPTADDFEGTLTAGLQIGYPLSLDGGVSIEWASPSANLGISSGNESTVGFEGELGDLLPGADGELPDFGSLPTASEATSGSGLDVGVQLIPQATATIDLAPGGGVVQSESAIATFNEEANISKTEGDAAGAQGSIQLAGVHGTATGILGNVTVRPYVTLLSAKGDSITTYGPATRLN